MIIRSDSVCPPKTRVRTSVSSRAIHRTWMGASLLLVTTLASAAAPADAARARALPTGGHASELFISAWDTDGDGKVSAAEYDATRAQRFAGADEDGNGTLNADEYVNEYAMRLDRQIADERKASVEQTRIRFRALDRNEDRFVSRAEYDASGERSFSSLDQDKDGRITKDDPEVVRSPPVADRKAAATEPSNAPRARQRSVISMPSTHGRAGLIEIYDTDGDGIVTREQYDAQRASVYRTTDTNGDGKIDESEYVDEFVDRLDRQIARSRQAQLKQGHVRFESIDSDKSGGISREEYVTMSKRMFERADTNRDKVVSKDDPAPAREPGEGERRPAAAASDRA